MLPRQSLGTGSDSDAQRSRQPMAPPLTRPSASSMTASSGFKSPRPSHTPFRGRDSLTGTPTQPFHTKRESLGFVSFGQPPVALPAAVLGDTVEVPGGFHGIVCFAGKVEGRDGLYLGVDLTEHDKDKGRNDGSYKGKRYFDTRGPTSGLFVPQGRCRVITPLDHPQQQSNASDGGIMSPPPLTYSRRTSVDSRHSARMPPIDLGASTGSRSTSRTLHIRPNSRMRSISGNTTSPPPGENTQLNDATAAKQSGRRVLSTSSLSSQDLQLPSNGSASAIAGAFTPAAHQHVLNENARLRIELEDHTTRIADLRQVRALQAQEMEDLKEAVAELRKLLRQRRLDASDEDNHAGRQQEAEQLQARVAERDASIETLRREADARRDEFRAVTSHQQETIDALRTFHERQLTELERKHDELEASLAAERAAAAAAVSQPAIDAEETLAQLSQLEAMCRDLQVASDDSRTRVDEAQSRIADLERENDRLLDELARMTIAGEERNASEASANDELQRMKQELITLRAENAQLNKDKSDVETHMKALQADLSSKASAPVDSTEVGKLRAELERERKARANLEKEYLQLEQVLERTVLGDKPSSSATRIDDLSPVKLSIATDVNGKTKTETRPNGGNRDNTNRCEFCNEEGHDILSCAKVVDGSSVASPSSPVANGKAILHLMTTPPRQNARGERWCENCVAYTDHFTEDCPTGDLEF
ncbi:hypothetical protein PYCC9005_002964 [Savitreella phatthalungensis]